MTPFQQRIYETLRQVPVGRVTTYKLLGLAVGCRSPRAVGQALRVNPFAPEVPCHRVIGSDLRIGGFQGARRGAEVERKKRLLASEGVGFLEERLCDPSRIFYFDQERGEPDLDTMERIRPIAELPGV